MAYKDAIEFILCLNHVLRRIFQWACVFILFFYGCASYRFRSLKKPLRMYCARKYRYFNALTTILKNSGSMLILLYSGDCGSVPVAQGWAENLNHSHLAGSLYCFRLCLGILGSLLWKRKPQGRD